MYRRVIDRLAALCVKVRSFLTITVGCPAWEVCAYVCVTVACDASRLQMRWLELSLTEGLCTHTLEDTSRTPRKRPLAASFEFLTSPGERGESRRGKQRWFISVLADSRAGVPSLESTRMWCTVQKKYSRVQYRTWPMMNQNMLTFYSSKKKSRKRYRSACLLYFYRLSVKRDG